MNQLPPNQYPALIHIGQPKTGTTFLQTVFFPNHTDFQFLGKSRIFNKSRKLDCKYPSQQLYELSNCLLHPQRPSLKHLHKPSLEHLKRIKNPNKMMVFSNEAFTFGNRDLKQIRAQCFQKLFGTNCRILITIREPFSFLQSFYYQNLKGYNFEDRTSLKFVKKFGKPPRHFTFDQWLSHSASLPQGGALSHLRIAETFEIYADLFGEENVFVKPFEAFKENNELFLMELAELLQIDQSQIPGLLKDHQSPINERWTTQHVSGLQNIQRSFLKRLQFRRETSRRKRMGILLEQSSPEVPANEKASVHFSDEWKSIIQGLFQEQIDLLSERWALDLKRYGYCMKLAREQGDASEQNIAA